MILRCLKAVLFALSIIVITVSFFHEATSQTGSAASPSIEVSPTFLYQILRTGETAIQNLTVTNNGTSDLTWECHFTTMSLAGASILWDRQHGQPGSGDNFVLINTITSQGASFYEEAFEHTPAYLSNFDVIWTTEASQYWTASEKLAIHTWLQGGGALLIEAENSAAIEIFNDLLTEVGAGVAYSDSDGTGGVTSDITSHLMTEGVNSLLVPDPLASIDSVVTPSDVLVKDIDGNPVGAYTSIGAGKIVVLSDHLFGSATVGFEDNLTFGTQVLSWLAVPDFLTPFPASGVIAPAGSQIIEATFDATGLSGALYIGDIIIDSDDPIQPQVVIPAYLQVTEVPDIIVSQTEINFFGVEVDHGKIRSVTVSNIGVGPLVVSSVSAAGPDFSADPTSFTLGNGESQVVDVTFTPSVEGQQFGTLTIMSNDPDEEIAQVDLRGNGFVYQDAVVSPDTIVTALTTGQTATIPLTLSNVGGMDLTWSIIPTSTPSGWLGATPLTGTTPPYSDTTITVSIDPGSLYEGVYQGNIRVHSDDRYEPDIDVPVELNLTGIPDISTSVTSLDFGDVYIGTGNYRYFTISNDGTRPLVVDSIRSTHSDFSANVDSVIVYTPVGVSVYFNPTSAGTINGSLEIASDDDDEPLVSIALTGVGVVPPVISVAPDSLADSLLSGETSLHQLTISNNGGSDLDWSVRVENFTGPTAKQAYTLALPPTDAVPLLEEGQAAAKPPAARTEPISAQLQDLTGKVIMWDRSHGQSDYSSWSALVSDLTNRGATVTTNSSTITSAVLAGVDVLWTRDCGSTYWSSSEVTALREWIAGGGGLLIESDQSESVYNDILTGTGIVYSGTYAGGGTTTNIYPHPTTENVNSVYFSGPVASLGTVTTPAVRLTEDNTGRAHGAAVEEDLGRIVVFSDELFISLSSADNQLFGNQVFDWLTGANDWLSIQPTAGATAVGAVDSVTVTFDAAGLFDGDYGARILISSNDIYTPEDTVPVYLHVTAAPDIAVSDTLLNYGSVYIGTADSLTLVVSNVGTDPLNVTDISSDEADFSPDVTSFSLNPGQQQNVVVTFAPSTAAVIAGALTITSNDHDDPTVTVSLQGEGLLQPEISVSPVSLVDSLVTGETSTQVLTIANIGDGILDWTIDVTSTPAGWLDATPQAGTLPPYSDTTITVSFDPGGLYEGDYTGNIRVNSNDVDEPTTDVPVTLHITGIPDISPSVTSLDFGNVFIGYTGELTFNVANVGTGPLDANSLSVIHPDFSVDTTAFVLQPGEDIDVGVSFSPTSEGAINTTLEIASNDPDETLISIPLSGEGLIPPIMSVSPDSLVDYLVTGQTSTHVMTISNSGGSVLDWTVSTRNFAGPVTKQTYTLALPPADAAPLIEEGRANAKPPTGRTEPISAELQDLTGKVILWDLSHGQSSYSPNWSTLVSDLTSRGATFVQNVSPLTPAILSYYDVVWTIDCGSTNWNSSEVTALREWIAGGGGLLIESDQSIAVYNQILAGTGIAYSSTYANGGTTTNIYPHPTTENVNSVYFSGPVASLGTVTAPAVRLTADNYGRACGAAAEYGLGRVVVFSDEFFYGSYISLADNQLFGNQVFDWLTHAADWLSIQPTAGSTAAGAVDSLTVTFNATYCDIGEYHSDIVVSSNDPAQPEDSTHAALTVGADVTPPETWITTGPAEGELLSSTQDSVSFGWLGSDDYIAVENLEYSYRLDNNPWSPFGPDTTVTLSTNLSEGSHTFAVKARDLAPNEDPTPAERSFVVDRTPPAIAVTSGPDDGQHQSETSVEFCWSATDGLSPTDSLLYSFSVDSIPRSAWASDTCETFAGLSEGTHVLEIWALDENNNEGYLQRQFVVDETAPVAEIVSGPEDGGWSTDTAVFVWTGTDSLSPVDSLWYSSKLDGGTWSAFTRETSDTLTALSSASHVFMVCARDLAGNVGDSVTVTFEVDIVPPQTWIVTGPPEGWTVDTAEDSLTYTWSGSDDRVFPEALVYSFQIDSIPWSAFGPDTIHTFATNLADGVHTFAVKSRDLAGNEDPTPDQRSFVIDHTPPGVVMTSGPGEGQHQSETSVEFCWAATDGLSPADSLVYSYSLDGYPQSGWAGDTCAVFGGLGEGHHVLDVWARDEAGNEGHLQRQFVVDETPPEAEIVSGPDDEGWSTDTAVFVWTGADSLSPVDSLWYSFKLDEGLWSAFTRETSDTLTGLSSTSHVFILKARDLAGNVGDSVTVTFEVDIVPPETWITSGPAEGELIAFDADSLTYVWTGSDNRTSVEELEYAYKLDDNPWSPFGPDTVHTFATNLADGAHTFAVKSRDLAGNEDPTPFERTFVIDHTPPDVVMTSGPAEGEHQSETSTEFCWAATDGLSPADSLVYSHSLDGAPQSDWASDTCAVFGGLGEGHHVLDVWARDEAGNEGHVQRQFVVDETAPVVQVVSGPEDGGWSTDTAVFAWTGADSLSPVDSLWYSTSLDWGAWSAFTRETSDTLTGLSVTSHIFMLKARDLAGNVGDSVTVTFEVDVVPPETWMVSGPAEGELISIGLDSLTYIWTGSDDKASLEELEYSYRLDGDPWSAFAPDTVHTFATNLSDGVHTFAVKSRDLAGKEDPTPEERTFVIDWTPPEVVMTSGPGEGQHQSETSAEFCWAATDGLSPVVSLRYSYSLDGGDQSEWASDTCQVFTDLSEGQHVLDVWARDEVGNEGHVRRQFVVDETAPVAEVVSGPEDGGWSIDTATFEWTGSDALCPLDSLRYSYRLNDDAWSLFTRDTYRTLEFLPDTIHVFMLKAMDLAGNVGDSVTVTFEVDIVDPETWIVTGRPEGWVVGPAEDSLTYTWSGSDDKALTEDLEYAYKLNSNPWSAFAPNTSYTFATNLSDGAHTFEVKARDLAGNEDLTPDQRSFIIDMISPEVSIISGPPLGHHQTETSASYCWSATDNLSPADSLLYSFKFDLGAQSQWDTTTCTAFPVLDEGEHLLTVWARDEVGNEGFAQRNLVVDLTPPVAEILSGPEEGGWSPSSATFAWTGNDVLCPVDSLWYAHRMDDDAWSDYARGTSHTFENLTDTLHVFMVKAKDLAGNEGDSVTVTFEVDIDAPETEITSGPEEGTVFSTSQGSVVFEWTGSDDKTTTGDLEYSYRMDGDPWSSYTGETSNSFSLNIGDGTHTFMVKARDLATNEDLTPATRSFIVDGSPPEVTFTSGPYEGRQLGVTSAELCWTATDTRSPEDSLLYSYIMDGGGGNPWTGDTCAAFTGLLEGQHVFEALAMDEVGNQGSAQRVFIVDLSGPTAQVLSGPEDGGWSTSSPTFVWTGVDNFASPDSMLFSYKIDDGDWGEFTTATSHAYVDLADTSHVFMVKAKDLAGNVGDSTTVTFSVDLAPPNTWITTGPPEGGVIDDSQARFVWTGEDDNTPVEQLEFSLKIDNQSFLPFSVDTSATYGSLVDGSHLFLVKARDLAGNEDPSPDSLAFVVDATAPSVTFTSGPAEDAHLMVTDADFVWSGSDLISPPESLYYSYRLDGDTYSLWSKNTTAHLDGLTEGPHVFDVRAKDERDHVGYVSREFVVDLTPPEQEITSGAEEGECWPRSWVSFGWTGLDNLSNPNDIFFAYAMDSDPFSAWSLGNSHTFTDLAEGSHTLRVISKDKAGNEAVIPDSVTFVVGYNDLVIATVVVPDSAYCNREANLSWTGRNDGNCSVSGNWYDRVYLSSDSLAGSDVYLANFLQSGPVGSGQEYVAAHSVLLPDNIEGRYWLVVKADGANNVLEEDHEDNNTYVSTPIIVSIPPHPDLQVTSISIPNEGFAGRGENIEWTISNLGEAPAEGGWTEYVYLSVDSIAGGDLKLTEFNYDYSLGVGSDYTHIHPVPFPEDSLGDYWIVVCANAENDINEYELGSNNCSVSSNTINLQPVPYPNLRVTTVEIPPDTANSNDEIEIGWIVTNTGDASTSSPVWYDKVYLSTNTSPGGDLLGEFQNMSYLGPGESYHQQNRVVTIPKQTLDGTYHIVVVTDARGNVDEHDYEGDNVTPSDPLPVIHRAYPRPDLAVVNFVPSFTGWAGNSIRLGWTVKNVGNEVAQGAQILDWVWLSPDSVINPHKDLHIGGTFLGEALDPDSTYTRVVDVMLPSTTGGRHYLYVWTDVDLNYDDPNLTNNFSQIYPIDIFLPASADLVVPNVVALEDTVVAGSSLGIQWSVKNEGAGPGAVPEWRDAVYLSVDDSLVVGADTRLAKVFHDGFLEPDESYNRSYSVTIPGGIVGTRYLFVYTDIDGEITEGDFENNNSTMCVTPLVVTEPPPVVVSESDLRVIACGTAGDGWSGNPVEVFWTVKNFGPDEVTASSWQDRAYLSPDTVLDTGSDTHLLTVTRAGPLTVNGTYSVIRNVTIPNGLSGTYYLFIKTDADGKVHEPDHENDNVNSTGLVINLTPPPDLRVTELLSSPDTLLSGTTAAVQWTVRNAGPGETVSSYWSDKFYLSADTVLNTGTDTYLQAFSHSGALDPDQFYQRSQNVTIPSGYSGNYYIIAFTDANNQVYEYNMNSNNTRWTGVTIVVPPQDPPPDLVMESLSFVDSQKDTLFYRVRNQSDYSVPSADRSWTDRFYLSTDTVLSTSSDALIASYSRSGDLAPGSSYSRTREITLPSGTEGDFYLFAVTDITNNVEEEDEANNKLFIPQHIELTPPDLRVTFVSDADSLPAGQPTLISWSVENFGTGLAIPGSWYDGVYLSMDHILDETDYNLGAKYHTGGLLAAGSYMDALEVTIPPGLSGKHYFFVKTDKNNNVYEHVDEDNNIAYEPTGVEIVIPPPDADLVVASVSMPSHGVSGSTVSINWTVRNQSVYDLDGQWTDAVYISPDTIWDLSDAYLGDAAHTSGLAAGAHYDHTLTLSAADFFGVLDDALLPGLVPDDYYAIVRTDIRNNINEELENNNAGYSQEGMSVDVAELVLNVPDTSSIDYKEQKYYKVTVPAGHDLRFIIDGDSPYDEFELFVRYGQVPDRINYEYTSRINVHEAVIVPGSDVENCYIMLYGDYVPGTGGYTILAESFLFELSEVTPGVVDNAGLVTFSLIGGHLAGTVSVKLRSETNDVLEAWNVDPLNSTRVNASFDLRGAEFGLYDVIVVTNDPDSTELLDVVDVVEGVGPVIQPEITGPDAIRQDVLGNYVVTLNNIGEADGRDIISAIVIDAGASYQLVIGDAVTAPRTSDGGRILLYTNFVGVGSSAQFSVRLWGQTDLSVEVLSVHSDLTLVQSPTGSTVISTWVDETEEAFADRLEDEGILINRQIFGELHAEAWYEAGQVTTDLLETKINEATLDALEELSNPLVPAQESGITALGLDAATDAADDFYVEEVRAARATKKKKNVTIRVARDPNEKVGPTPPDEENFVTQLEDLTYTVYFENVPDASAAARQVVVTDQLDPDLNWRKFRLGEIAFGDTVISVPLNKSYYHTTISLDSIGMLLEIDAGVDVVTGEARWIFSTIDPTTGLLPEDPNAGFLPPNDDQGSGEGHVFFTIKADPEVEDGTEITNEALIVFDTNDPIITNEVTNVVQRVYPDLAVTASSGGSAYPSFIEGEEITISATVTNESEAPTGNFTVAFFDGDPDASGTIIGAPIPVAGLDGNGETIVQTVWIPHRTLEQHQIYIEADYNEDVDEIDEENNNRILVLEAEPKTYTVSYAPDINLVALPLEPLVPYTARTFAELLGAAEIIRYDTTGSGMFETFLTTQSGDGFEINNKESYIAVLDQAKDVTFTGITHDNSTEVKKGLNLISLPLEPNEAFMARSFSGYFGSDLVIRYINSTEEFDVFMPDFDSGNGYEILGARGYMVVAENDMVVTFDGSGWIGTQESPPGGYRYLTPEDGGEDVAHVLGITGKLSMKEWNNEVPMPSGCKATVINTNSGANIPVKIYDDTGEFSGAFVDFMNDSPIRAGDGLRIIVTGPNGVSIGDAVEYVVTEQDIERKYAAIDVVITGLTPSVTRLYQNFPNPFNPITHIRYQTTKTGKVSLRIYNVAGQLVKTLVDDSKRAGYYQETWKGYNNNGNPVASGVYFYKLVAPDYVESLKMVIVR